MIHAASPVPESVRRPFRIPQASPMACALADYLDTEVAWALRAGDVDAARELARDLAALDPLRAEPYATLLLADD